MNYAGLSLFACSNTLQLRSDSHNVLILISQQPYLIPEEVTRCANTQGSHGTPSGSFRKPKLYNKNQALEISK
jgi:hypothetical protein